MQNWSGTFGARTTADEAVAGLDLSGQLVIVTGANSGIGFHTARALASAGARVIFACRDGATGVAAVERTISAHPGAIAEVSELDLGSRQSIRDFAGRIDSESVDALVCNAGVFGDKVGGCSGRESFSSPAVYTNPGSDGAPRTRRCNRT